MGDGMAVAGAVRYHTDAATMWCARAIIMPINEPGWCVLVSDVTALMRSEGGPVCHVV